MTTAAATLPARRFQDLDILLIALWGAIATLAAAMPNLHGMLPCIAAGGILIARQAFSEQVDRGALSLAVVMPVFGVAAGAGFAAVNHLTPVTYDGLLGRLDCGIAPAVRAWALNHGWAMATLVTAYKALPETILVAVAFTSNATRRKLITAMYLGSFLSLIWYVILPAVGPAHVGDATAPRNCMPSMHCTWAFLMYSNARGWMKVPTGIFAALTVAATLATGEHYTPDLLAALPWAWTLNKLAGKAA